MINFQMHARTGRTEAYMEAPLLHSPPVVFEAAVEARDDLLEVGLVVGCNDALPDHEVDDN